MCKERVFENFITARFVPVNGNKIRKGFQKGTISSAHNGRDRGIIKQDKLKRKKEQKKRGTSDGK